MEVQSGLGYRFEGGVGLPSMFHHNAKFDIGRHPEADILKGRWITY